jgi:iron-sulfur cluster repair protein YtfE (RIC family)
MASKDVKQVFDFLDATHAALSGHLATLMGLAEQFQNGSLTPPQLKEVRAICNFFEKDARQHHLDEELHIFPPLLQSQDGTIRHTVLQLQQDHGWLEENWIELRPLIEQATLGNSYIWEELDHALQVFHALYQDHMVLEERIAYPGAKAQATTWDGEGIGREMASRRKLRKAAH